MATKRTTLNYQTLNDELTAILADLQRNDLDVDTALQRYERGLIIIKQLEDYLTTAENKVTELKAKFSAD